MKLKEIISKSIETPWKMVNEILMYLIKPFVLIYLAMCGVKIGTNPKFYGFPRIYRHSGSKILIGKNFECRSWWFANPLGINHPTIFSTWKKGASIKIGDNVGISGGSIVASTELKIGDGTLIGANCTTIDTDFHPINSFDRRYSNMNIKSSPVVIGKNVFVGTNVTILKGVRIPDNSVVPAGAVITRGNQLKNLRSSVD